MHMTILSHLDAPYAWPRYGPEKPSAGGRI